MARSFMFAALCQRAHPLKHSSAESEKTAKKIFVSRKIRQQCHSLAEVSLYLYIYIKQDQHQTKYSDPQTEYIGKQVGLRNYQHPSIICNIYIYIYIKQDQHQTKYSHHQKKKEGGRAKDLSARRQQLTKVPLELTDLHKNAVNFNSKYLSRYINIDATADEATSPAWVYDR